MQLNDIYAEDRAQQNNGALPRVGGNLPPI